MATTWFARSSSVNISAFTAFKSTVWFDVSAATGGNALGNGTSDTFLTALQPGDVLCANGHTALAIDATASGLTCLRLSTTAEVPIQGGSNGNAGGGFTAAVNATVNANVIAGTGSCIAMQAGTYTLTVNGSVTGGSGSSIYGITNSSSATASLTIANGTNDAAVGGSGASAHGVSISTGGTGAINITGAVRAVNGYGLYISGSGRTITITGNVTGSLTGGVTSSYGVINPASSTLNITGTVTGGSGSFNYGVSNAGTCTIAGNVIAGSGGNEAFGVFNGTNTAAVAITNGNIINTLYTSAIVGPATYNPGPGNYIEYPKTPSGVNDFALGSVARPTSGQIFPRGV